MKQSNILERVLLDYKYKGRDYIVYLEQDNKRLDRVQSFKVIIIPRMGS